MCASPRNIALSLVLTALSVISGYCLIFSSNREIVFVSGFAFAAALYFWRSRFRLTYGLFEVVFGLLILWDATGRAGVALDAAFDSGSDAFRPYVVLMETLGSIYVLVRGFENCRLGLGVRLNAIKAMWRRHVR